MRGRAQDQRGMTLVEVLVAATILVIGVSVTVTTLVASRRLSQTAERKQQALSFAQADIERFRSLPYNSIGTKTLPASGSASNRSVLVIDVNGTQVLRVKPLGSLLTDAVPYNRIAPAASGGLPQTESIRIGNTTGTVNRYVAYNDTCVLNTVCLGPATAKRVTVVVQLSAINGKTPPPVVSETVVASPISL